MNQPFQYLSVCSGIEAASTAWKPLGWKPVGVAEIDPFACAVLSTRHAATRPIFMPDPEAPGIKLRDRKNRANAIRAIDKLPMGGSLPNFGDLEQFKRWPDVSIDLLVGGTPCQSFSVAGLRSGLDDPRGNLALVYLGALDRYRPRWVAWKNVPGVLSCNKGRDFGAFLGGLAQLGYGWAYRVVDAQFVRTRLLPGAVPQRRRRVFVVGYLGDWRPAHAVLFDRESLLGNPPPSRKAGKGFARGFETGSAGGSLTDLAPTLDAGCKDGRVRGNQGVGVLEPIASNAGEVGFCLAVNSQQSLDAEQETLIAVAHTLRGEGFDATEDGSGRGTPIVPVAPTLRAGGNLTGGHRPPGTDVDTVESLIQMREAVSGPLTAGMHKSAARMPQEQGTLIPEPLGFSAVDSGGDAQDGLAPTLRAMGHASSHPNAGGHAAVAFDLRGREGGAQLEGPHDTAAIRSAEGGSSRSYVASAWAVRRLTPRECERLQGFPDDYTDVPFRGKNSVPDGPRYKAIGNSMAVNVMEWLGQRIELVESVLREGKL